MRYTINEYKSPVKEPVIAHSELNLAKWPQLFATKNTTGKSRVIERNESKVIIGLLKDNKGREVEVGFLIVPDYITLLGLIYVWEVNDSPTDSNVTVQVRNFVEKVLERHPGRNYQLLENSLVRLTNIPIQWINAFFDSKTGKLETLSIERFTFLQYLRVRKATQEGQKLEFKSFAFKFNDHFLKSLTDNKTKPVILSEVVRFKSDLTVLAYIFLDLVMAKRTHWSRRVMAFIRDDLANKSERYNRPKNCLVELERVVKELRGSRLSTGILKSAYIRKTKDGKDYKLVVVKEPYERTPTIKRSEDTSAVVEQMMAALGHHQRNVGFYTLIAQKCSQDLINTALRDTIDAYNAGEINTSKAAYFGWWIQELAKARGIELGLKSSIIRQPQESPKGL